MTRILQWDGCLNVRDLGGVATEDDGETSYRVVVRSDNVHRLRDLHTLERHGVSRVVDLRFDEEVAYDPRREAPVETVRVPLMTFDPANRARLEERAITLEPASTSSGRTATFSRSSTRTSGSPCAQSRRRRERSACTAWAVATARGS